MKAAIVTVAGISSRFNEGVPEDEKELKAVYSEGDRTCTLLWHILKKCSFADRIIIVGGYKFDHLSSYCRELDKELGDKIVLVFNEHYEDLGSGYSLYMGLCEAFRHGADEILFVEGDLDIDWCSFKKVIDSRKSVLTYNYDPIYANKAVVLYQNEKGHFQYAFNSSHGLLSIQSPFSCILNSGQTWKFSETGILRAANDRFYDETKNGTNLQIIQNYLDSGVEVELVGLERWTNCNTRDDYKKIAGYWEKEE